MLVDPAAAFAATAARPRWVLCLAVAALFAVAPPIAFLRAASDVGGPGVVVETQLKRSGRWNALSESERARVLRKAAPALQATLPAGAVAKRLAWIVVCALLCLGFLRATQPGLSAGVVVAAAAVGSAPLFLRDVIAVVTFMSVDDVRVLDATNPVASNLAAWFAHGEQARTPLGEILRALDLFELWAVAWMATGIVHVAGGRTRVPWVVMFAAYACTKGAVLAQAAFLRAG